MVWENAKQLAKIGLDVHCISPYYNVNNKGETDYLKKFGIEFKKTIRIYIPNEIQLGIHYGVVDGVKCWFMHNFDFFGVPLCTTGDSKYKVSFLSTLAKGSLELICNFMEKVPRLIVSIGCQAGFVSAFGRFSFKSTFDSSLFLHVIDNLEQGYNGKIYLNEEFREDLFKYILNFSNEYYYDSLNNSIDPTRSALMTCDQWATVSKRYRHDILESSPYSYLLKKFNKPFACSNGIDIESRKKLLSKIEMDQTFAKRIIQKKYFGSVDDKKCLFVYVGPIEEQKGVNLIADSFEEINQKFNGNLMFIVHGKTYQNNNNNYYSSCTNKMIDLRGKYQKNFWFNDSSDSSDFDLLIHAADYVLVPSLFEPSGIIQQKAFASGSPVIAFKTGGLNDTVSEFNKETKSGNGLLFWCHECKDFIMAIERALTIFKDNENYKILRKNALNSVLTTEKTAAKWLNEFTKLISQHNEK